MRKFFLFCSMGVLSIGWLTGCSLFRGPDTDACKCRVGVMQERCTMCPGCTPGQRTPSAAGCVAVKSDDKTAVRVNTEAKTIPAPAKPVAPAPPPRLPAVDELPALPPPALETSANTGLLPTDKIVVVSNLEPISAKPATRELIDVTKPEPANVPMPRATQTAPEKTVVIKDMQIHYGHEANFTSITGQVLEYRKTLRLRYAAVDQEDVYGGVVVLEGGADLRPLRDGKHVRVRGVLILPTEHNETARYRVTAVEILD